MSKVEFNYARPTEHGASEEVEVFISFVFVSLLLGLVQNCLQ